MHLKKHLTPILCLIGIPALANPFINLRPASATAQAATAMAAAPATLPSPPPVSAADVIGYWSKTQTWDMDLAVTFQLHFETNGSFETRVYSKYLGQESRVHGYGTWTLKGESVELVMDTKRCLKDEGEGVLPCDEEDSEPWTVVIRENLGVRSLVDTADGDDMTMADYVGPQKQFTLPVISKPTAVGPSARDGLSKRRRGLSIPGQAGSSGSGFDMTGRATRQGATTTPRVPLNYYKLR